MNQNQLGDDTEPSPVDQQQACSPLPWEPIPEWMFGKSVEARNALQNCGRVHPYTCGNNDCRKATNQAPLRAVEDGWVCDHCGYTQSNTANDPALPTARN